MNVNAYTERKNGVVLTKKVGSLAERKFDPGFRVIAEYLSPIDSQYEVFEGRIFVSQVTQPFRSK